MFPANSKAIVRHHAATAVAERVVVAVRAEKVISKTALAWALTHVVRSGDCITLLAVFPGRKTGRRFWHFPKLTGECSSSHRSEMFPDRIYQISESCSQMVLQFHNQLEVKVRIKVVSGTCGSAVAAEAKSNGANWVILDKKLKQELKHCIEELSCNIVTMKGSQAKVLRLNLQCSNELQTPYFSAASSPFMNTGKFGGQKAKHSTPVSSPEEPSSSSSRFSRTGKEGLLSISDRMTSLFLIYGQNPLFEGQNRGNYVPLDDPNDLGGPFTALGERLITLSSRKPTSVAASNHKNVFWIPQNHNVNEKAPLTKNSERTQKYLTSKNLRNEFDRFDKDMKEDRLELNPVYDKAYIVSSTVRDAVSLGRSSSIPPPLCSQCQHKAPVFGKPPRRFSYEELEEATDGFSNINFLAEGGFGVVYRGVLRDGQVVAAKLLRFGGSQADADFCREVQLLSCAQHRNVVLLIGFCIDRKKRVLVYEYICNGSLDLHLHGNKRTPLDWHSRLKIALGAARGLRYLHEDCRVGCIIHRDMRPNNILVTHDFEPLVADFGLARWHSEWNMNSEERVIGTSGYLAPEYVDGGMISQKVDVYAFGLLLLELLTGRRMREMQLCKGQHFLSHLSQTSAVLEPDHILANIHYLLDPCLASDHVHDFTHQLQAMTRAALLCLQRDPESRPSMSKILRILEGADPAIPFALDLNSIGNRSGHLRGLSSRMQPEARRSHSRRLSH